MNTEKELITLINISKKFTVLEICYEVMRLMDYNVLRARDLTGVLVDATSVNLNRCYLLFLKLADIERMKIIVNREDDKLYLYIFNSKIEVLFSGKVTCQMDTATAVGKISTIRVKNRRYQSILDVLDLLPRDFIMSKKIKSINQTRNCTFISTFEFDDSKELIKFFVHEGYEVIYSTTYSYICRETLEETEAQTEDSQMTEDPDVLILNETEEFSD